MGKKKRRKKNNRNKKVFDKNLLIKEEIEARKEIELEKNQAKEIYLTKKAERKLKKKLKIKNKKKKSGKGIGGLVNFNFLSEAGNFFSSTAVFLKKWKNIIWLKLIDQKNIKRDVVIIFLVILGIVVFLSVKTDKVQLQKEVPVNNSEIMPAEEEIISQVEEEKSQEMQVVQAKIDTEKWKDYKSNWFGFSLKYPDYWPEPIVLKSTGFSGEVLRMSFLSNEAEEKFSGFQVAVYDLNVVKEFSKTAEFPAVKNQELFVSGECEDRKVYLLETGEYPAEEIYVPLEDRCYRAVLFFSVVNDEYVYNITPILKAGAVFEDEPMKELSENLPEFFEAAAYFENIDIVRPQKKTVTPKINAPKPVSYKVDEKGRLVCAKKKDKPSKSKQGKKKHLDMECCLDPDEYPNPHCYYDPAKYGKYLK